jgi:hypothetical protein
LKAAEKEELEVRNWELGGSRRLIEEIPLSLIFFNNHIVWFFYGDASVGV